VSGRNALLIAVLWFTAGTGLVGAARAQPDTHRPGAAELFAALAAPDREARVERLRVVRRMLANTGDAHAVEAARAQVDTLLLAEANAPEQPPALVMATLAERIDTAVAALERSAATPPASVPAAPDGALMLGLAAAQALLLGLGLAVLARRLGRAIAACVARLDALAPVMAALPARVTVAEAETVGMREAEAAVLARFEVAVSQIHAELGQSAAANGASALALTRAAGLAEQIERVANALPALMGEAAGTLETSCAPALVALTARLDAAVAGAEAALTGSPNEDAVRDTLDQAAALGDTLRELSAGFTASLTQLQEDGARHQAVRDGDADRLAQAWARLDQAATRQAGLVAALTALPETVTAAAATAATAAFEGIAPQVTAALAPLAQLPGAVSAIANSAQALDDGIGRLHAGQTDQSAALTAAMAEHQAALGRALQQAGADGAALAARLDGSYAGVLTALQTQQAGAADAAAQLEAAVLASVERIGARADAALSLLTPEAGLLSATGARVAEAAQALQDAAAHVAIGSAAIQAASPALGDVTEALRDAVAILRAHAARAEMPPPDGASVAPDWLPGLRAELMDGMTAVRVLLEHSPAPSPTMLLAQGSFSEDLRLAVDSVRDAAARLGAAVPADIPSPAWLAGLRAELLDGMTAVRMALAEPPRVAADPGRLGALTAAIAGVTDAVARVAAKAEAHEASLAAVIEAARDAAEAARAPAVQAGPARLEHVARECTLAFAEAEALARAALAGQRAALPPDLPVRLPALLHGIEGSIGRLRGCATALALASDTRAA